MSQPKAFSTMFEKKESALNKLDILCSIWILACNDDNPQITYKGISHRLGLPATLNVKELVLSRGELFRKQTTLRQLKEWKDDMLSNKRLPTFIREIEDDAAKKEAINALTISDIFRSQFRSEADSPKSDITIIDWGLQHIDRLRKAELESKQEKTRFFSSVIIPVLSAIIAILAVASSFYVQYNSNKNQTFLKHFEVELKPKQEGYTNFIKSISKAYFSANSNDLVSTTQSLDLAENAFYLFEPFLNKNDRDRIWNQYQQFSGLCYTVLQTDSLKKDIKKSSDSFLWYKNFFRDNLYSSLFSSDEDKSKSK